MSICLLPTHVRPATDRDIQTIIGLHELCFGGESAKGFFLDHGEAGELTAYIHGPDRVCLLAESEDGEPVGFVQAGRAVECLDRVMWTSPGFGELPLSSGHWHVDNVAVSPAYAGAGIGRRLYEALRSLVRATSLSAYVVRSPKVNEASLAFHARMGFAQVGEFCADEFCGVKNYASVLLMRTFSAGAA